MGIVSYLILITHLQCLPLPVLSITLITFTETCSPLMWIHLLSLQAGESFHIKVVELEPHLSFLGGNLDEAVLVQKQHDELLAKLEVSSRAMPVHN